MGRTCGSGTFGMHSYTLLVRKPLENRDVEPVFYDGQIKDDKRNSTYVRYVILTAKSLGSLVRRRNNSVKMEVRKLSRTDMAVVGVRLLALVLADISLCLHYHKWSLEFMRIFVCS